MTDAEARRAGFEQSPPMILFETDTWVLTATFDIRSEPAAFLTSDSRARVLPPATSAHNRGEPDVKLI